MATGGYYECLRLFDKTSDEADPKVDLQCPVCHELFNDPCFVCPNHHTLCRECYQGVLSAAPANAARCPQCRQPMSRPVENAMMTLLIKSHRQVGGPKQASCQAKERNVPCSTRAFQHCEHCSRDLCRLHFSKDHIDLQAECDRIIKAADDAMKVMKEREAVLNKLKDLIKQLERQCLECSKTLASSLAARLADVTALRSALNTGDMRQLKKASDRLKATGNAEGTPRLSMVQLQSSGDIIPADKMLKVMSEMARILRPVDSAVIEQLNKIKVIQLNQRSQAILEVGTEEGFTTDEEAEEEEEELTSEEERT